MLTDRRKLLFGALALSSTASGPALAQSSACERQGRLTSSVYRLQAGSGRDNRQIVNTILQMRLVSPANIPIMLMRLRSNLGSVLTREFQDAGLHIIEGTIPSTLQASQIVLSARGQDSITAVENGAFRTSDHVDRLSLADRGTYARTAVINALVEGERVSARLQSGERALGAFEFYLLREQFVHDRDEVERMAVQMFSDSASRCQTNRIDSY